MSQLTSMGVDAACMNEIILQWEVMGNFLGHSFIAHYFFGQNFCLSYTYPRDFGTTPYTLVHVHESENVRVLKLAMKNTFST